jgi:hypothetical protein
MIKNLLLQICFSTITPLAHNFPKTINNINPPFTGFPSSDFEHPRKNRQVTGSQRGMAFSLLGQFPRIPEKVSSLSSSVANSNKNKLL